ncbi:hypothetical protein [Simplicispira psychrophila]|uniref:hypothetical protein n=1 Tax=Simplicispira psychrophila TaxID=80882 RepID=UPI0006916D2B|nr:hypothetical protein [Simplicispira psychrophila]
MTSTGLQPTPAWSGHSSRFGRDFRAEEELQQWRTSLGALAQCIENALQARRLRRDAAHITRCAVALWQGVRQHQFFLTGLDSAWHTLYSFDAYQNAQQELSGAVQDWRQALEERSLREGDCFDRVELLAWRTLGEGVLLVDIYQHGNGPLSEAPPVPLGRSSAAWLRLRAWWQRYRAS